MIWRQELHVDLVEIDDAAVSGVEAMQMIDDEGNSAAIPLRFGHSLSFGDLLQRASQSADVAQGLALAYASFEPSVRAALIGLIRKEAAGRPGSMALVMCHLLAAENDTALARDIAHALARASSRRQPEADCAWFVEAQGGKGKALVGFAQRSNSFHVYELHWDSDAMTHIAESLDVSKEAMHQHAQRFLRPGRGGTADCAAAVPEALDSICELLWRRRGSLGTYRGVLTGFVDQISL